MFREFKLLFAQKGFRGWRLEDEDGLYYLSKFDDHFNDDEYRFYITMDGENIHIKKMNKIKSYHKIMKVKPQHEYIRLAEFLCTEMREIARRTARA